jgi:hypothetical protein
VVDTRSPKQDERNSPAAAAADRLMKVRRVSRLGNIEASPTAQLGAMPFTRSAPFRRGEANDRTRSRQLLPHVPGARRSSVRKHQFHDPPRGLGRDPLSLAVVHVALDRCLGDLQQHRHCPDRSMPLPQPEQERADPLMGTPFFDQMPGAGMDDPQLVTRDKREGDGRALESDGGITSFPFDDQGDVPPIGCAGPTFGGSGFDVAAIDLMGVRLAVSTMYAGLDRGYPRSDCDVGIIAYRRERMPIDAFDSLPERQSPLFRWGVYPGASIGSGLQAIAHSPDGLDPFGAELLTEIADVHVHDV